MLYDILNWIVAATIVAVIIYYMRLYELTHRLMPFLLIAIANMYALGLRIALSVEECNGGTLVTEYWRILNFPLHLLNLVAVAWLFYAMRPIFKQHRRKNDKEK